MMMRFKIPVAVLLLTAVADLFAQIGLEISLNRRVYMRYEPIYACIAIRNDSGRPLLFGNDPKLQGFILFEIKDSYGRPVKQAGEQGISVAGLYLAPGAIKRMVIPVNKYYELEKEGSYSINVYVSHNCLPHEYQSSDTYFRVEDGIRVWSRTVGLTDAFDNKTAPDVARSNRTRTYTIRALDETPNRFYYLMVEDESKVYGVMRIGRAIGTEKFQAEVDMLSRIHLLMPMSPSVFHYLAFSIDGMTIYNNYWKKSDTIPMLYRDPDTGLVTRLGGVEAKMGLDFKDPNQGTVTAARLMDGQDDAPPPRPVMRRDSGLVELGKPGKSEGGRIFGKP